MSWARMAARRLAVNRSTSVSALAAGAVDAAAAGLDWFPGLGAEQATPANARPSTRRADPNRTGLLTRKVVVIGRSFRDSLEELIDRNDRRVALLARHRET